METNKLPSGPRSYVFNLTCISGGFGWGETGQRGWAVWNGTDPEDAQRQLKPYVPGGWTISYLKQAEGSVNRFDPSGGHLF